MGVILRRSARTFPTVLSLYFVRRSRFEQAACVCLHAPKTTDQEKDKFDVKKIMSSGSAVECVHYFCSVDVPVATRHELIDWARESHSVGLEIHDGESLAELLSGRDVFWIAESI